MPKRKQPNFLKDYVWDYWEEAMRRRGEIQQEIIRRNPQVATYAQHHWPDFQLLDELEAWRAAHKGNGFDLVLTRLEALERDQCCCRICDKAIDVTAKYPDPGAAVFIHRKSLSGGGPHTLDNLLSVHYHCSLRRAGVRGQRVVKQHRSLAPLA